MDAILWPSSNEDSEPYISTIQELVSYFSENKEAAVELVGVLADLDVSDGVYLFETFSKKLTRIRSFWTT